MKRLGEMFKKGGDEKGKEGAKVASPFYTRDIFKGDARVVAGEYTYGSPKVFKWNDGTVLKIGKFCSISDEVVVILGGNHRPDWLTTYPFTGPVLTGMWKGGQGIKGQPASKGDVVIGNDVWIAYGATILSGVTIGDGAVIAARSVVVKDVAPYSIVAGNPAREIRKRFDEKVIERLLELRWWDWPPEKIDAHLPRLCGPDTGWLFEG